MATYREHPPEIEPPEWNDYQCHASDCSCDVCMEAFDHEDVEPVPSQAELERRFQYFMKGA